MFIHLRKDNNMVIRQRKAGFTLVEIIVVIAIIAILVAIAIPTMVGFIEQAKIGNDKSNLGMLNRVTLYYASLNQTQGDVFNGLTTDEERMNLLVSEGYLDTVVETKKANTEFIWDVDSQSWLYTFNEIADQPQFSYIFSELQLIDYRKTGSWSINNDGFYSSNGLIFIDNNNSEYTLTSSAVMSSNTTNCGYGVLFETSLTEDNLDTGFVLQFDRGYSRGSILIRPRIDGNERNPINGFIFNYTNSFLPDKNTIDGNRWWSSEHEIILKVEMLDEATNKKKLSVWVDDELLFDNFEFISEVLPVNNFTGFRSWGAGTTYEMLEIE